MKLRLLTGPRAGDSLAVAAEVVIGREGTDVAISDPELSRRHVVVRPAAGGVVVEDLGSTNGTFVEGRRITGPVTLAADDTFVVGKTEIVVEAVPAQATKAHAVPAGATKLHEVPGDATDRARALPRWWPAALAAPILVVILILALSAGGDDAEDHALAQSAQTSALTSEPTRTIFVGIVTGRPTGLGSVSLDLVRARSLRGAGGADVGLTGKIVLRFDNGSMSGTIRGTVTPQPDSSLRYAGTGRITSGTADHDGATGSFRLEGTQAGGVPRANFTLRGELNY